MTVGDWHTERMDDENDRIDWARRVREGRFRRGWTKEEAARRTGMSSITWKRIEDAKPVQEVNLAKALAAVESRDYAPDADSAGSSDGQHVSAPGPRLDVAGLSDDEISNYILELAQEQRRRRPAAESSSPAAPSGPPSIRSTGLRVKQTGQPVEGAVGFHEVHQNPIGEVLATNADQVDEQIAAERRKRHA